MKASKLYLLAIAALALVAIFLGNSIAQTATAPAAAQPASKILVCDVVRIFNQYQKNMDNRDQYNQKVTVLKLQDDKKLKEIEAAEMELKSLKEGSTEYDKRQEDIEQKKAEHQVWQQVQERSSMQWHVSETQKAYDQILKAVAVIAKERGAQVVLYVESGLPKTTDLTELLQAMERRKVVYSDDSLDVTDEVITNLNTAYAATQKKGAK